MKRLVRLRRLELPLVRDAPTIIFGAGLVPGVDFEHLASVCISSNISFILFFPCYQWAIIFCWSHVGDGFSGLAKIQKVYGCVDISTA